MSENLLYDAGNRKLVFSDHLEGLGVGGGRGVQEGADVCIPMTDSS